MENFSSRLHQLMAGNSIGEFAKKLQISEPLLRKYLKGSDPGLSKARQIASNAGCSLEWLATGEGEPFNKQGSGLNLEMLELTLVLVDDVLKDVHPALTGGQRAKLVAASYEYVRTATKGEQLDKADAITFIRCIVSLCR